MSFKGSDETYLEAFVENCLPTYQIKRNMELIQSLDRSCVADLNRLHGLEDAYLVHAETAVLQLDVILPQDSTTPATVRPLGKGSDRDETDDHPGQTLIPTTDELIEYTYQPDIMTEIEHLQQECLQKADEKVSVAEQSLRWIDSIVQRLDDDIEAMEELIGHQEAAQPNELAACQVTPGSEWILAKVLEHDVKNGFYRLADEDVDSQKVFHLPASQVVVLRGVERLSKGDTIFAVYPDTTSFYQATVVQVPRKTSGQQFVMVNFVDDSDEFGVTHDKAVSLQHIMLPPPMNDVIPS